MTHDIESWLLRAQASLRDGQPQVARIEIENALNALKAAPQPISAPPSAEQPICDELRACYMCSDEQARASIKRFDAYHAAQPRNESDCPQADWAPARIWLQRGAGPIGVHTWADHRVNEECDEAEYVRVGECATPPTEAEPIPPIFYNGETKRDPKFRERANQALLDRLKPSHGLPFARAEVTEAPAASAEVLPADPNWVINKAVWLVAEYRNCKSGDTKEVMQRFVDYMRAALTARSSSPVEAGAAKDKP